MRSLVWHGPYLVRSEETPRPEPGEEEALIRVSYAGICGSDLTVYVGMHPRAMSPLIMGHEFTGEIVEMRSAGSDLRPGDRVVVEPLLACGKCYVCREGSYRVCRNLRLLGIDADGGFAEYVKAPIERVYRVPEGVSPEAAALTEPTAVAVHAVRRARVELGDRVLVLGGGPIGLLVAQVARLAASMPVDLVEIDPWRLELARKLGFDPIEVGSAVIEELVLERTGGRGADVLFDCAGSAATAVQATELPRTQGRVVQVAVPRDPHSLDVAALALKELELVGVRGYDYHDFSAAINLIANRRIDAQSLVSHVLPLERGKEGLELARKAGASMKVLLKP